MRYLIAISYLFVFVLLANSKILEFSTESSGESWTLEVLSQDASSAQLKFKLHNLEHLKSSSGDEFLLQNTQTILEPGLPTFPEISEMFHMERGLTANFSIIDFAVENFNNIQPKLSPNWVSDKSGKLPPKPERADSQIGKYNLVELSSPVYWLGECMLPIKIKPFNWNAKTGDLELITEVIFQLEFSTDLDKRPRWFKRSSLLTNDLNVSVINPEPQRVNDAEAENEYIGRYLVVCPEAALQHMSLWVDWKRQSGWHVSIFTDEDLNLTDENWDPIYNLASGMYYAEGLDCLLLIGDNNYDGAGYHMPGPLVPGGQYAEWPLNRYIVSDHPLSMLEGDDYFPDILVGRISVDNATQLNTVLNRNLGYEKTPYIDDLEWYKRAMLVFDVGDAGSRREISLSIMDMLYDINFQDIDTLENNRYTYQRSPQLIASEVNNGLSLLNYRGYGFRYSWNGPLFDIDYADNLNNYGRWPLVTSIVCGGGDFGSPYSDPCLGEAFIRAGNPGTPTGAIAFIGPSEEDTHTMWNNLIDLGIYQGMCHEDIRLIGSLMNRGKFELWQDCPNYRDVDWQNPGSPDQPLNVPFYFHCYNLLGDPGMEIRLDAPVGLAVDVVDVLPVGVTQLALDVSRVDALSPIELRVVLCDSLSVMLALTSPGENGNTVLNFAPLQAGEYIITVNGRDIYPYQQSIIVQEDESFISLNSMIVNDNQAGNADARLNAGEEFGLDLHFVKHPGLAEFPPFSLEISSLDDGLNIQDGQFTFDSSVSADTLIIENIFSISALASLENAQTLECVLSLIDDHEVVIWEVYRDITVHGNTLEFMEVEVTQGALAPGSQAEFRVHAELGDEYGLETSTAILYSNFDSSQIIQGESLIAESSAGSEIITDAFEISFDSGLVNGSILSYELVLFRQNQSTICRMPFTIELGDVSVGDPMGPDEYGYMVYHSLDQDYEMAPEFVWNDISELGGELDLDDTGYSSENEGVEGVSVIVDLPFTFRFYDQDYETMTVCSNGWVAMGGNTENITGVNGPIPSALGPENKIALFWTDLYNHWSGSNFGHCYDWYDDDNGLYYIQWDNFQHVGNPFSSNYFQLVLRDPEVWETSNGNAEILIYYEEIITDLGANTFTTGIEGPAHQSGLQYTFNGSYGPTNQELSSGDALLFTPGSIYNETGRDEQNRPEDFRIISISPNPFNPATTVMFNLPTDGKLSWGLYNLLGQKIMSTTPELYHSGVNSFVLNGHELSSAIYLLRLSARLNDGRELQATQKILLTK
jgi:hypothetical protein